MNNTDILAALEADIGGNTDRLLLAYRRLAGAPSRVQAEAYEADVNRQWLRLQALHSDLRLLTLTMAQDAGVRARSALRVVRQPEGLEETTDEYA